MSFGPEASVCGCADGPAMSGLSDYSAQAWCLEMLHQLPFYSAKACLSASAVAAAFAGFRLLDFPAANNRFQMLRAIDFTLAAITAFQHLRLSFLSCCAAGEVGLGPEPLSF